jgi:dethiobiotin synthetase
MTVRAHDGARPGLLVVLTGTGTEVGKTWVACGLARRLRAAGAAVEVRKPVQSFDPTESEVPTDADALAAASGEDPWRVCPAHRRYEVAMAPPMAADVLDRPTILLDDLVAEVAASWHGAQGPGSSRGTGSIGVVELAGGVRSPLAHDGDGVDFVAQTDPDVVIVVADAGLGTINAVTGTLDSLSTVADPRFATVVHLNRFDPEDGLHRRNRDWLAAGTRATGPGVAVTTSVDGLAERVLGVVG